MTAAMGGGGAGEFKKLDGCKQMPWIVNSVRSNSNELDLSSSGQPSIRVTQILLDDELFANAAEVTSWNADKFQVAICEACAIEHCQTGGWVKLRYFDDALVFLPCFAELYSHDSWEATEYAPPAVAQSKGVPVLRAEALVRLRSLIPSLPSVPRPLTEFETALALRFEAPRYAFRATAEGPKLDRNALVASSEGELADFVENLDLALTRLLSSSLPAKLRPLEKTDRPITLFVDDRRFTEWKPIFAEEAGGIGLLWGDLALEPADQ